METESVKRSLELRSRRDREINEIDVDHELAARKEIYFKSIVLNKLFNAIKEGMEESDLEEEDIAAFFEQLKLLPEKDIMAVLAIPAELHRTMFSRLAEMISEGRNSSEQFLKQLLARANEHGFRLGFHTSKTKIMPEILNGRNGEQIVKWEILGSEADHRDEDINRAYYSFDFQHLYRKRAGNYLYLIRAETGEQSSHRKDNDGRWGRASSLPIIAELDLTQVDKKINGMLENDRLSHQKKHQAV